MKTPRQWALLLVLLGSACADPDNRIPVASPDGGPGAEVGGDAGCACTASEGNIVTSLACHCRDGCRQEDYATARAAVESTAPSRCVQLRDHPGCGLKGIARLFGFAADYSVDFYDAVTGERVGSSLVDDVPLFCPGGSPSGRRLLVGRVPGPECAISACQERCGGGAWTSCTRT